MAGEKRFFSHPLEDSLAPHRQTPTKRTYRDFSPGRHGQGKGAPPLARNNPLGERRELLAGQVGQTICILFVGVCRCMSVAKMSFLFAVRSVRFDRGEAIT
jgi:hypothetical protein